VTGHSFISGEQPREMLDDGRLPRAARTVDADEQARVGLEVA
jgi:hypothetical protein